MDNTLKLNQEVYQNRKEVVRFVLFKLLTKILFYPKLILNRHIIKYLHNPLNYVRQIEVPLAINFLSAKKNELILDISSPKIISLFLSLKRGCNKIISSDYSDYFLKDFQQFSKIFKTNLKTKVFDGRSIPFKNNYFDKIFSISVLEHIPDYGDKKTFKEMVRVLKPGGKLVISVPMNKKYIEEYVSNPKFYWQNKYEQNNEKAFFQRRYSVKELKNRFFSKEMDIDKIIYLCEKKINKPRFNKQGKFLYNNYWADKANFVNYIPFVRYFIDRYCSKKYHYFSLEMNNETTHGIVCFSKKI